MTEQEAIKWIDDRMCYGRYTPQKHNPFICDECCQAGEMAIEALEKQIAKKPVGLKKNICPNCSWGIIMSTQKYCDECGQKFDWTEDVTAWKSVEAPYQKGE